MCLNTSENYILPFMSMFMQGINRIEYCLIIRLYKNEREKLFRLLCISFCLTCVKIYSIGKSITIYRPFVVFGFS